MKKRERSKYVNLTDKRGISLIVLIVTIIVIIILAAAVILTITKNNPVSSAKESAFKEDVRIFQDDLALTVAKEYTDKQGQRDQKISTSDYDKIKNYIPSFTEKYKGKFIIQDDQLVGTDSLSEKEKTWANDINISTSGKAPFDSERWDETATNENCFLWAEDGTTITGLDEEKLSGVTKIRIPSKCKVIRSDYAINISEDYRNFIKQMVTVEIPDTVTEIGDYAFYEWNNLENVTMSSNITSIGERAFLNCNNLTGITIPESVTSIGEDAFYCCSSLTNIVIPNSVTSIGRRTFGNCSSLTNITIPESVTSIGYEAFSDCSSLTSITIPESVTSIGNGAFCDCSSLTNITIPESVTSIGYRAFYGCRSLTSITISEGVTSIGERAFDMCSSLTNITIPNSVTSIGINAFDRCSSLTNITYNGTQEQWNNINKVSGWNEESPIATITCTDGVIQIN